MWISHRSLLPLGTLFLAASGAVHNLFVGNLALPASVHSLTFDEETNSFKLVRTMAADAAHAWIAFDHAKENIYGASLRTPRVSSYRVTSPTTIELERSIPASGACFNKTSAFIEAMKSPPYHVFSASWPGPNSCGMSISANTNGSLDAVLDSWSYANTSGVHGLALREADGQQLIYSADLNGDKVWTHAVDRASGKVSEVGRFSTSRESMHPRHLAVHSNGRYLYVLMENDNSLVQYDLDQKTGSVVREGVRYLLYPEEKKSSMYWSAEVMLSRSERYLWATARAQRDTTYPGYISAFLLSDDGQIVKRMFMVPTTTVGGWANQISPAPWSDEYAAMADHPTGYVQMFKMEGRQETEHGVEYTTAIPVARVDIADGGCCANTIWYN